MRHCLSYRVRCFHSKGACFVLLWTFLISTAASGVYFGSVYEFQDKIKSFHFFYFAAPIAGVPFILILLFGWLADAKLGNFKLFKTGSTLFFVSITIGRILFKVAKLYHLHNHGRAAIQIVSDFLGFIGAAASLVTALQLGLDQMPDASAANITSFIAWFVCSLFAGAWISDTLLNTLLVCIGEYIIEICKFLLPSLCMAIVCSTMFIFAPTYIVVEPESPKSLKTIYQVLKFAAKHRAPLNRSAFTYWEEDIPSRVDLGKSKYGGPFTTEQVEDVKTFFKILAIHLPFFIVFSSLCIDPDVFQRNTNTTLPFIKDECSSKLFTLFTSNRWWSVILTTIVYEFVVFPLFANKIPTILVRIGFASILLLLIKSIYTAESVMNTYWDQSSQSDIWVKMTLSFFKGSTITFISTGVLEFVCAQAPYNMRGLLTSSTIFLVVCSATVSIILQYGLVAYKVNKLNEIICNSIATALSLVGFILHCILAHWYKRRVRDEEYSAQRVVEEIYDRYLSQAHVQ